MNTSGQTYTGSNWCSKCGKPFIYVGDVFDFPVGFEPWCTCGTEIYNKCGQRYTPKPCDHDTDNYQSPIMPANREFEVNLNVECIEKGKPTKGE